MNTRVAIIGCGPAGLSAAIQLYRYGIEFRIFEKNIIGGLLNNAYRLDNFPGFPNGIEGSKICGLFQRHLKKNGIEVIPDEIISLRYEDKFILQGREIVCFSDYCIASSGTKPIVPPIDLTGMSNIYFDIINIKQDRGKMICIAGSGDAALDYALTMSKNNDVKILIRSKKVKALDSLVEAVNKKRNIEIISQTEIMKIAESKGKLNPECISTKGNFNLTCDILIFAIGREADLSYISDNSILKSEKFYMAGDIKNGNFRQAAIAIADGIRAAMDIHFKMGNNGTLSQDIRF